jgi:kinesin family protein C2/C3
MQSGPKVLSEESVGVNYRALNDLFNLQARRKGTIDYEISVQMIEIYNEQVRDLLQDSGNRRYPFYIIIICCTWSKKFSVLL